MNKSTYWSAGHITAFFKIVDESDDLLHKGSCGAGFNIKRGVVTEVTESKSSTSNHHIYFGNKLQPRGTVGITEYVIQQLGQMTPEEIPPLDIKYTFQAPIGAGFGTSAAGALTTVFAINSFLKLDLPEIKLWQIAHKAEITNKTGLGDILGLYAKSKFELRVKEGAPGIGIVNSPDLQTNDYDVYSYSLGPLSKKNILTDPIKRTIITKKGAESIELFKKNPTFENFCTLSVEFAKTIDLLPKKLWDIINALDASIKCSQIMLGESLFFFVPKEMNFPSIGSLTPVQETLTDLTLQRIN